VLPLSNSPEATSGDRTILALAIAGNSSMSIEQLGPYKIGRKLGRGGMGTVFEAVLTETGETAAIKLLSASLAHDDGFRDRFKAEIETLRKLRHPNIVRLYGFGEQDEYLYYAMELVNGRSLEDELQAGRRFNWQEAVDYGIQTCRALKHAHDRGVIHRDMKPANLLLAPTGEVKLSDFGIAKLFGSTGMTASGGVLGTAEFMAPEQADGRPVTHRCDLYSLGGVIYTLLAGRPPFRASNLLEMLQLQRYAEPDPVRRYAPEVPEELELIINQLLEKDPERRVQTAMVLSRRLEAMRHGLSHRAADAARTVDASPPRAVEEAPGDATLAAPAAPQSLSDGQTQDAYTLSPDVSPTDKTEADRRARMESVTADLRSITEPAEPSTDEADASSASGGARFTKVGEDEHHQLESTRDQPTHYTVLQALALVAALASIGAGVWWFSQPVSADRLYQRIIVAADEGKPGDLAGKEGDIKAFLANYATDPRAAEIEELQKEIDLRRLDKRFQRLDKQLASTDARSPVERAYGEAMDRAKFNPAEGMAKLQAVVDLYGSGAGESEDTQQCLQLAQRQLERLRKQVAQQAHEDSKLLNNRLNHADDLARTDPPAARAIRRAVVELYADKPWAAEAVRRAESALAGQAASLEKKQP
jgi:eukaryotic-like serine/threonine-protein kinase